MRNWFRRRLGLPVIYMPGEGPKLPGYVRRNMAETGANHVTSFKRVPSRAQIKSIGRPAACTTPGPAPGADYTPTHCYYNTPTFSFP